MSETTSQRISRDISGNQDVLVEVDDLKKHYGGDGFFAGAPVKAVDGVSFAIKRGETLGLVGESGCGKSTLGRLLVQLESATAGTISFDGTDVTALSGEELKRWRPNAQMVFQDPESSLNERMTVGAIIREPLDVHEWQRPPDRRERVMDLLTQVGLQEAHYYRYPHQFSGGQRQRIGIARALALNPEFLVLDEPVSALDTSVQARILNLLEDLQDEFNLTYFFIAHDLSVVRHISDRVAVMYLGKIMELGATEVLYNNPSNPYTISLLSAIPEPDPSSDRQRITLTGTPPSPRDPPTGCQFTTRCPAKIRPEGFEDVAEEIWNDLERFREVIRERSRHEFTAQDRLRRRVGRFSKFDDIDDAVAEFFDETATPERVMAEVQTAAELVKEGYPGQARSHLRETFSSVCDVERPVLHDVGAVGHNSYCHRHAPEFEDPQTVLERRFDGG